MYNVFLAISIVTELIATTFLKYTEGFTKLWPSVITILADLLLLLFPSVGAY